ncbi:O-antigen polymerase [Mucilaginibacter terrae]|uniref:O-antigen polymerase n=1 Tax=Mucilaginibacter terrae TaxID=1955052 RepID=UPI003629A867
MTSLIIFLSLAIFMSAGYVVWPSRYNVITHLSIGGNFIATFVPAIILNVQDRYSSPAVELYKNILLTGAISFVVGLILGFSRRSWKTKFTFDLFPDNLYQNHVLKITKILLIISIILLSLSYLGMGFVPAFAADPLLAKFFRGPYQAPYMRVAVLFRSSFYILSTIIPIAAIAWYQTKSKFFLLAILTAVFLMALSLSRSPAFSGLVLAFATVMSFKGKFHFRVLLLAIVGIYVFSSIFYYLIGARELDYSRFNTKHPYWEIIASGSSDIDDQLQFVEKFIQKPTWTYGRTMVGGLIPGHYEWNPSVYTLNVLASGEDLNEIISGGLRLPVALWGYVSFGWVGVVIFSLISGFLYGYFLKYVKTKLLANNSLLTKIVLIVIFNVVFSNFYYFYILSLYIIPPSIVMLLYMYRFKSKPVQLH